MVPLKSPDGIALETVTSRHELVSCEMKEACPEQRALKTSLRAQALAARDALDPITRIEASLAIAEQAGRALVVEAGTIISGFLPIRSEVDIRPLMSALREKGARLCLPAMINRHTIVFRDFQRGADLVDTGFGTLGPDGTAALLEPDMMLMPLAGFDAQGNRLGYGAGHYDRAIAGLRAAGKTPFLVGIGFDCQQCDDIPVENHDLPLHAILTESGLRFFTRGV